MARGKRPVPFRTRKLSLSAPMVLPWRRGGRVGRPRTSFGVGPFREELPFSFPPSGACVDDRRGTSSRGAPRRDRSSRPDGPPERGPRPERPGEPPLLDDVSATDLESSLREELASLSK